MKILIVNKFLHPNGGSETYIFKIGSGLQKAGHEVQYFGMEHKGREVGNAAQSYTSNFDFHTGKLQRLIYPFKIIYSLEARRKIRKVLKDFSPDVVHLNNFNFQLTPSIIYEIKRYKIPIIYTAHDSQLVCPNHLMTIPDTKERCTRCLSGSFFNCTKYKCIHGSRLKSLIGSLEAYFYKILKTYKKIDCIISPSRFLGQKLSANPLLADKIIVMPNFIEQETPIIPEKEDYVLYFGRYSEEKGIGTLLKVCESLPEIPFIFAGSGPMEESVNQVSNIKNMGFQTGEKLKEIIAKARFSVFASECFENCPFSVMESQMLGTPVVGADIGGIPELIQVDKTGELFESGNQSQLKEKICNLWLDQDRCRHYTEQCKGIKFDTLGKYCSKLITIYQGKREKNG